MEAPREELAYVAILNPERDGRPDALGVLDVDPASPTTARWSAGWTCPNAGDELHHFGWNACSAALCPTMPHPHVERRYLLVPGLRSSRIYVVDTKADPRRPELVKTIEPEELTQQERLQPPAHRPLRPRRDLRQRARRARTAAGRAASSCWTTRPSRSRGAWEKDRGPQHLAYDFWWHLGHDAHDHQRVGHAEHGRGRREPGAAARRQVRPPAPRLGPAQAQPPARRSTSAPSSRWCSSCGRRTTRTSTYGFVGVVVQPRGPVGLGLALVPRGTALGDGEGDQGPGRAGRPDVLPPLLKGFGAVPPLVTDINLSLDDRFLYVSCWGTGEFRQYDVSDPFSPKLTGSVAPGRHRRSARRTRSGGPLNGGPQMVEVSRDGRRVYLTNSLYASWDAQFYPEGIKGWVVKIDAAPDGGIELDPDFFVDFGGERPHQIRLQGGDSSSDSYCFP